MGFYMCGIVGYIGYRKVIPVLVESLKRLEYRGYDSAGIGFIFNDKIVSIKKQGRIANLKKEIRSFNVDSSIGIGHTRWATHGKPSDKNSHPHLNVDNSIALVHNGIIENFKSLKEDLISKGIKFVSDTDTEVIVHLLNEYTQSLDLESSIQKLLKTLEGSFALSIISQKDKDKLYVIRKGSPIVIGLGECENFVASDIPAILNYTNNFLFLEEEEYAILTKNEVILKSFSGEIINRKTVQIDWDILQADKQNFKHYMLKEIYEQTEVFNRLLHIYVNKESNEIEFNQTFDYLKDNITEIKKIDIVACGTSYYAAMIGRLYIEEISNIPVEIEIGSEYRYRKNIIEKGTLLITISQSGETADTLASLRKFKKSGNKSLSICNVMGSSLSRESDYVLWTEAGPEIGVASTKSYTAQIFTLLLFALFTGSAKNKLDDDFKKDIINKMYKIPETIKNILKLKDNIYSLASKYYKYTDFLFIGRYYNFPTAMEGALKLKEISYIHAEGYAAGEMKHGPIALIDSNMPVIAIACKDTVYEKVVSNLEEVKARKGLLICIINENDKYLPDFSDDIITIPYIDELLSPIINIIPLQLFAYSIADWRGCDIDKPRNLAKSVTVE